MAGVAGIAYLRRGAHDVLSSDVVRVHVPHLQSTRERALHTFAHVCTRMHAHCVAHAVRPGSRKGLKLTQPELELCLMNSPDTKRSANRIDSGFALSFGGGECVSARAGTWRQRG